MVTQLQAVNGTSVWRFGRRGCVSGKMVLLGEHGADYDAGCDLVDFTCDGIDVREGFLVLVGPELTVRLVIGATTYDPMRETHAGLWCVPLRRVTSLVFDECGEAPLDRSA